MGVLKTVLGLQSHEYKRASKKPILAESFVPVISDVNGSKLLMQVPGNME